MYSAFVFIILFLSVSGEDSVHIEPAINPGCSTCSNETSELIYVKVYENGGTKVVHQVWDFTGPSPTVLYAIGYNNSTLDIVWDGNTPTEIVTRKTCHTFAMILTNLMEYNDTTDKGYFVYNDKYRKISLRNVKWRLKEKLFSSSQVKVVMRGELTEKQHGTNGTVDIELLVVAHAGKSPRLPHLTLAYSSTQVDVSLAGLSSWPGYNAGRFALRYSFASDYNATKSIDYSVYKSIDDEYTPGIFETVNLVTPGYECRGYVQHRPVAYTAHERSASDSVMTDLRVDNQTKIPNDCLARRYFETGNKKGSLRDLVVSIGQTGDGFYKQTNYTAWTYTIGYGSPPEYTPSRIIVLIVVMGAGLPLLMVVVFCLIHKRLQRHREAYLLAQREA